ncbi:SET and MYND domain-containing protein 3 [Marasmius crinis-equi]|uniref:SET and MYND domain-containing protein 3 n=1 Tax=Marasmius crinis-equi TaxID=585013 RepID=A0ABR3F943_9AGAR
MNSKEMNGIKHLQTTPPLSLDINYPNHKAEGALSALVRLADGCKVDSAASRWTLIKYWDKVWPWIHSYSRAILDTQPSTVAGYNTIDQMLTILPFLILTYLNDGKSVDSEPIMDTAPRIRAYPELPTLALEVWSLAVQLDHPSIAFHGDSFVLSSAPLFQLDPVAPARKHFYDVLYARDIPLALVKGVIQEASRQSIDCAVLRNHLSLFVIFTHRYEQPPGGMPTFLEACTQRGALRWATYAVLRVASPKRRNPKSAHLDDLGNLIHEALLFIGTYFDFDIFSVTEALDAGILHSLFLYRDLIAHSISPEKTYELLPDLADAYSRLLDALTRHLHYRSITVRVIRAIRRVEKEHIDAVSYLKDCGILLEYWTKLCNEATAKYTCNENQGGWYDGSVCGNTYCPHLETLRMNHKFKRCGACREEVYCSIRCQKAAWRQHRRDCEARSKESEARRKPTSLDLAFLRKCVYQDFYSAPEQLRQAVHHVVRNEHMVIFMDYSKLAKEVKPVALSAVEGLFAEFKYIATKDLQQAFSALAIVPWRRQPVPIMVFIRAPGDKILDSMSKVLDIDWKLLATRT